MCLLFLFLVKLHWDRTSIKCWTEVIRVDILALFPVFGGSIQPFTVTYDVTINWRLFKMPFINLMTMSSIVYIMNGCLILCSYEDDMFFFFILVIWWITLINFLDVKLTWYKSYLVLIYYSFLYTANLYLLTFC